MRPGSPASFVPAVEEDQVGVVLKRLKIFYMHFSVIINEYCTLGCGGSCGGGTRNATYQRQRGHRGQLPGGQGVFLF